MEPRLNICYRPSEDIVAREIEGELLIIPLVSGIGDGNDNIYSLDETGREIWKRLDGHSSVAQIISDIMKIYTTAPGTIEQDVLGLIDELERRKIIVKVG